MRQDFLMKRPTRTLADILVVLWAARLYIAVLLVAGLVLSSLWLAVQRDVYRVRLVIGPISAAYKTGEQPVYAATDPFDGTPLYPVKRSDVDYDLQHFIKVMRSEHNAKRLLKEWSDAKRYFTDERSLLSGVKARYQFPDQGSDISEASYLAQILKRRVRIAPDGLTPFYEVSFEGHDVQFARSLLTTLFQYGEEYISEKARADIHANIVYLRQRLSQEKSMTYRKLLSSILVQEETKLMMVESDNRFGAQKIEDVSLIPYAVWPKAYLVYLSVLIAAFVLGVSLFGIVQGIAYKKRETMAEAS